MTGQSPSRLQRELGQSRPFRSPSHEAFLAILKTADVLRHELARIVEPHGLTPQQYNVLRIVRGAMPQGIPTLSIGERLIESTPGMTRLLDRLESKKLVRRTRCESDRRQVLCRLTEEGAAVLASLDDRVHLAERPIQAALGEGEILALIQVLERIRSAAAQ